MLYALLKTIMGKRKLFGILAVFVALLVFFKTEAPKAPESSIVFDPDKCKSFKDKESLERLLLYGAVADRADAGYEMACRRDKAYVPALILALNDGSMSVRRASVYALGKIKDPRATAPLLNSFRETLRLLATKRNDIEKQAFLDYSDAVRKALIEIKDPGAVSGLIDILKNKKMGDIRYMAASALGGIGDKRAVQSLIEALNYKDNFVPTAAAFALGDIKDPAAVEPLIADLKQKNQGVLCPAITALGEIGDSRAIRPLSEVLKSGDSDAREAAAWALGKIKAPASLKYLIRASGDRGRFVGSSAVYAMGALKDPGAVVILLEILNREGEYLKREAVGALGDIGDKRAIEPLQKLLYKEIRLARGWPRYSYKNATYKSTSNLLIREDIISTLNKLGVTTSDAVAWTFYYPQVPD